MNRSYKSIWNAALGACVAVSEITRATAPAFARSRQARKFMVPKRTPARRLSLTPLAAALVPAFLTTAQVQAQSIWVGGTSTDWATAANWSPAAVPGGGVVEFNAPTTFDPVVSSFISGTARPTQLLFTGAANQTITINAAFGIHSGNVSGTVVMDNQTSSLVTITGNNLPLNLNGSSSVLNNIIRAGNSAGGGFLITKIINSHVTFDTVNSANTITMTGRFNLASVQVTKTGAGTLFLHNPTSTVGGSLFMNGGVTSVQAAFGLGYLNRHFDGGTLQLTNSFTVGGGNAFVLDAGGGTIDTGANTSIFTGATSGVGALTKIGTGTLVLSGNGSYTGGTTIAAGTLQLGDGGTTGSITGNVINGGTLAFNRSDTLTFDGTISGTGSVSQVGTGTTTLTGNNTYAGGTTIAAGTLQLGDGGTTGTITGNVINDGTLVVNRSDALILSGAISGTGAINQAGAGTTILTGNNTYAGGTTIAAGTLQLGNGGTTGGIAGNILNGGTLAFNRSDTLIFGGTISGAGTINQNGPGLTRLTANSGGFTGTTNVNAGTLSVNGILGGAMNVNGGRLQGIGQVGDTTNFAGGTIAPGNSIGTLLINGNYIGNGGVLEMEGFLAGTGSPADRLLITGNASGSTLINVINTGGSGALTGFGNTNGISIVQVAGASTASTFQLTGGYAAAGPYQYQLVAFDPASSAAGEVDPLLGAVPFWDYRLQSLVDASGNPVVVPQMAAYQALPSGAFRYGHSLLDSVHQRQGEIRQAAALRNKNGGSERNEEFYLRGQGSRSDVPGGRGAGYDQDLWFVQAGGNVFGRDLADGASLRFGGAVSIGGSKLQAQASSAKVDLDATTLALTSTYQAATGWFLDAVAQGTRYSTTTTTSQRGQTGAPDGRGWGLSLEGGYPIEMGGGLTIQPQAQLAWQRVRFDTFTDVDGINVDLQGGESLRGRAGVRAEKTAPSTTTHAISPFAEVNLLHEFFDGNNITASGVGFNSDLGGTSVQFSGGLNAQLGKNTAMFASLGYEKGVSSEAADIWTGNIGVRINF
jgi:outer membrane autotransporter protein